MGGKYRNDYLTHMPVDFGELPSNYLVNIGKESIENKAVDLGELPSNYLVNKGKEIIINKYSEKNESDSKEC